MENPNEINVVQFDDNCFALHLGLRQTSAFKFAFTKAIYSLKDEMRYNRGITQHIGNELLQFDLDTWEKIKEAIDIAGEITLTWELPEKYRVDDQ